MTSDFDKGFQLGQQSSQQRILGIIDDLANKSKKMLGTDSHKITCACGKCKIPIFIKYEELKSLINSPKTVDIDNIHDTVPLQSIAQLDLSADRTEPDNTDFAGSIRPDASINVSGSSNSICVCGHDRTYHMFDGIYKSRCEEPYCKCKKFTPKECGR